MFCSETVILMNQIHVNALLSTGPRAVYDIPSESSVSDLIDIIKQDSTIEKPPNKIISIIHSGKMLKPQDKFCEMNLGNEFSVNVFFRMPPQDVETIPLQPEIKGFDRLSQMGYSQEQIAEIRLRFHENLGTTNASHDVQIEEEDNWFPTLFNQENPLEFFSSTDHPLNNEIMNRPPESNNQTNQTHENDLTNQTDPTEQNEILSPNEILNEDLNESSSFLLFWTGSLFGTVFGAGSILIIVLGPFEKMFIFGVIVGIIFHTVFLDYIDN